MHVRRHPPFRALRRLRPFAPLIWLMLALVWSLLAWSGPPVIAGFGALLSLLAVCWPLLALQVQAIRRRGDVLGRITRALGPVLCPAGRVLAILAGVLLVLPLWAQHPLLLVAALVPGWAQRILTRWLAHVLTEEATHDPGHHS